MKRFNRQCCFVLTLLGLAVLSSSRVLAEDVVVVLSSNLRPYQETLAGFEQALGHPVSVVHLSDRAVHIPSDTQVVVAIGGKAALQNYPRDVSVVYCLAPGVLISPGERTAPTVKIYMTPSASVVIRKLKDLQPGMKKLGVLGLSESRDEFNQQLQGLGPTLGVQVLVEKMGTPNELPDRLRGLRSQIDALWIPPDPHLITPQNFNLIKEFCSSNHIAFYVPTVELVEQGATASVAASFDDIGRTAGEMAKALLSGHATGVKVYPDRPRVAINLKAAKESGLTLSADQLHKADKVIP